jgi:NADH:quinone reductase (non-electrogenic)
MQKMAGSASGEQRVDDSDVLILGGGFAGTWCARRLGRRLGGKATITLISSENYFVYQPLLPDVVGASLEPRHAISPLRYLCKRAAIVRAEVRSIDARTRTVEAAVPGTEHVVRFRGRHLVLALGSIVDVSRIPGLAEHSMLMKNVADALALRQTLIGRLERALLEPDAEERAALLTFVVVGGGFSGVETAAAMRDFLTTARRYYPKLNDERIRVVCVHSGSYLMPEMRRELGEFARTLLLRRGLEIMLDTRAESATASHLYLHDGSRIAARTLVCTIGNAPHPALQGLGVETVRGAPVTDEYLRVKDCDDVWAIGDCAHAPDGAGGVSTPTAQFAVRHGESVADNIVRQLQGRDLQRFRHALLGSFASLGHRSAVAQIGSFRFSGFIAWWMWRMVYLAMLPRLDFKLRVALDWLLDLFFPRDINYVDVRVTPAMSTLYLAKDELLFEQGDVSDAFYVVLSGSVELVQRNAVGEVVLREVLGRGVHFGEGSLLRDRTRTTTARALEASCVLRIGPRDFEELIGAFALLRKTLELTAQRFRPAEQVMPRALPSELRQLPIRRIMASPVKTLPESATLRDALATLARESFGCYPVVDGDGRLKALATRTDLYAALRDDLDLDAPFVDSCSKQLICLGEEDSLGRCVEVMRRSGVKHVPVVDAGGRLTGMVSFRDVVRELLRERVAPADAVR